MVGEVGVDVVDPLALRGERQGRGFEEHDQLFGRLPGRQRERCAEDGE